MENIHPLFVHFPIAFLNVFFILELLAVLLKKGDLRIAATWMLYIGTLGAAGAVSTGLLAASSVEHSEEVHHIMLRHRNLGIAILTLGIILSAWRFIVHGKFQWKGQILHLVLSFILVGAIAFGSDLGGLMVYKHGVAVQAVTKAEEEAPHHH